MLKIAIVFHTPYIRRIWGPLEKGPLIERVVVVAQDIEEDLTEEGGDCCELSCFQPSSDVVPPEMSEDYFTAVFNTERIEMSVIH